MLYGPDEHLFCLAMLLCVYILRNGCWFRIPGSGCILYLVRKYCLQTKLFLLTVASYPWNMFAQNAYLVFNIVSQVERG